MAIYNVNSHTCKIDAGPLMFPVPCMHLSSAQLKAVRDPPCRKEKDTVHDPQSSIHSQYVSPYPCR